ncbi:MAG: GAF domain-containing protein [Anaerolineae bacterium]|nr:GAF domain-containing protein [Anaerolineae bacterium]
MTINIMWGMDVGPDSMRTIDSAGMFRGKSGAPTVIWLGPDSALLSVAWTYLELFHVTSLTAALSALQHRLAPCLVLDLTTPDLDVPILLASLDEYWPSATVIALTDDFRSPLSQAIAEDVAHVLLHTAPITELVAVVQSAPVEPYQPLNAYVALQDRARQLESLIQASYTFTRGSDAQAILGDLRMIGQVAVDADDVAVLLATPDYADLADSLHMEVPEDYLVACRAHLQTLDPAQRLRYLGDEVLVRERTADTPDSSIRVREADAAGARSYMRFPLNIDERLVGFVALFSQRPGQFNGAHLQLGRLFTTQVAAALRNVQQYVRIQRVEERQRTITAVAELIAEDLALEDVLRRIAEEAVRLVGGTSGVVVLVEKDRSLTVRAIYTINADAPVLSMEGRTIEPGTGQAGMIALTGRASVVTDYKTWKHANPTHQARSSPGTQLVGVPLSYRKLVLGVLQVIFSGDTRDQHPDDMDEVRDVLMMLAPQAAIAIAKAQLHDTVRREERQLQTILRYTPAAVIVCDAAGRIQRANRAAEHILTALRLDFAAIEGCYVADVIRDLLPDDLLPFDLSRPIELSLGSAGEYLITVAAIRDNGEGVTSYVGVAQDVTALRSLDRMRASLHRVLTHDLGNLIMLARNPLELLDEPDLTADQREQLKAMLIGSLARMQDLVSDVMNLEMADALGQDKFAPYDLTTLVRRVVRRNADTAERVQVELTFTEYARPPKYLMGHAVLIMQAVDNLVSNAVKYSPDGGYVEVTLDVDDAYAIVCVTDTGMGIAPEHLHMIFEPFKRVKNDRTHRIAGTGLGLNLVKTFVEAHGGHITVESAPDQGSTFTIFLPLDALTEPRASDDAVTELDLSAYVDRDAEDIDVR